MGARLDAEARRILQTGLDELLRLTGGLEFGPLPSEKYPLPLARAVYGCTPSPQQVRDDLRRRADSDPVSVLESALVLLELYESNQDDMRKLVPEDMSNIHHSRLHRDINSFGVTEKGRCIDPPAGEWEGVNRTVTRLSKGRTRRVQLHSLDEAPHTGCGCFRIIMFKTDRPRPGIGLMAAGYEGCAPDGRAWKDLHYELAGKQTPGLAGAPPSYLRSAKFLQAHGGWKSVVWVCPKVAAIMGDCLPEDVAVGDETAG
ncbi:MAG: hypothetical protein GWP05_00970 [Anaerolineaceae bacterium]|nr:hypothetical protein [Anaerolineaceae bacterium]